MQPSLKLGLGLALAAFMTACGNNNNTPEVTTNANPEWQSSSILAQSHRRTGEFVDIAIAGREKPVKAVSQDGHLYVGDNIVADIKDNQVFTIDGQVLKLEGNRIATRSAGILTPSDKWTNATVPFVFDASATATIRSQFNQAVQIYNTQTVVRYVARTNQANYVRVVAGSGCSSYVGMVPASFKPNGQEITLGSNGCGVGASLHEMGHAAGFWHEQQRKDRDQYITVNYSVIAPAWRSQYDIEPNDNNAFTAYDYNSIMHYGNNFVNGQWEMTSKNPNILPQNIGGGSTLTASDIQGFKAIYGGGVTPPTGDTFTGTLSGTGANAYQPSSSGFSYAGGTLKGNLTGPSNVDFDLFLEKKNGTSWSRVGTSEGVTATEAISYSAASGTYRWRILAYSGSGSYTLTVQK
jgi:Astacin (Peptidase family M12A)